MIAVILDMDGVISDTQTIWSDVQSAIMRRHGVQLSSAEVTRKYAGVHSDVMFRQEIPEQELQPILDEVFAEMERRLTAHVPAIPGAVDAIRSLHAAGFPLGIASGAPPQFIRIVIGTLGIEDCFSCVTSGYEVPHGKPAPDVFLLAAERLGVQPSECIVVEDGYPGIVAANAAGMRVIALNAPEADAAAHIGAMSALTPALVRSL